MTEKVRLAPVERIEVLTVIDNVVDLLLMSTDIAKRIGPGGADMPAVPAPLLDEGAFMDAPVAEHGLSYLVSVTVGGKTRTLLLDTGSAVGTLMHNLHSLNVDPSVIETIVLSHGHFDHTMGLNGMAEAMEKLPPILAHPDAWLRRRIAVPGSEPWELPTVRREKVEAAGFQVIDAPGPSALLGEGILVTGQIERTTDYEQGLPVQEAFRDGEWQPDPLLLDDQALIARLPGKGLVVVTGCGHSGVVNTLRYARKLTGEDRIYAVLGGFHLAGLLYEPVIPQTVEALREMAPEVIVPSHCTGWRAIHAIAAAFPDAFLPGSVGTRYVFEAGA